MKKKHLFLVSIVVLSLFALPAWGATQGNVVYNPNFFPVSCAEVGDPVKGCNLASFTGVIAGNDHPGIGNNVTEIAGRLINKTGGPHPGGYITDDLIDAYAEILNDVGGP
ncbi:MAG: hypothetical protein KKA90_01160 [Nanoarchaeota archaeon]|nr:hypothetical protein [Nanoarchaeota archaeon]